MVFVCFFIPDETLSEKNVKIIYEETGTVLLRKSRGKFYSFYYCILCPRMLSSQIFECAVREGCSVITSLANENKEQSLKLETAVYSEFQRSPCCQNKLSLFLFLLPGGASSPGGTTASYRLTILRKGIIFSTADYWYLPSSSKTRR